MLNPINYDPQLIGFMKIGYTSFAASDAASDVYETTPQSWLVQVMVMLDVNIMVIDYLIHLIQSYEDV